MNSSLFSENYNIGRGIKKILTAMILIGVACIIAYLRYDVDDRLYVFYSTYFKIILLPVIIIFTFNIKFLSDTVIYKILYLLLLPLGLLLTKVLVSSDDGERDNPIALEILSWCIIIIVPIPLLFFL